VLLTQQHCQARLLLRPLQQLRLLGQRCLLQLLPVLLRIQLYYQYLHLCPCCCCCCVQT
jgi:hypothetical protein